MLTGAGVAVGRSERTSSGDGPLLFEWIGRIAPVAFVIGYLLILSSLIHRVVRLDAFRTIEQLESMLQRFAGAAAARAVPLETSWVDLAVLAGLCVGTGTVALTVSWLVDLNEFSLHNLYRNRLVRCFLGASRTRAPNPFTGFDSDDDLPLAADATQEPRRIRPYPIFNVALNLVGGQEPGLAAAQGGVVHLHARPTAASSTAPTSRAENRRRRQARTPTRPPASTPATSDR